MTHKMFLEEKLSQAVQKKKKKKKKKKYLYRIFLLKHILQSSI